MTMSKTQRFIYQTQCVCPPEIHFQIQDALLKSVRFVAGGCPGNAQLVACLLEINSGGLNYAKIINSNALGV